ncbi:hypothetical protein DFAR_2010008 [Desulfarculales bacterium]
MCRAAVNSARAWLLPPRRTRPPGPSKEGDIALLNGSDDSQGRAPRFQRTWVSDEREGPEKPGLSVYVVADLADLKGYKALWMQLNLQPETRFKSGDMPPPGRAGKAPLCQGGGRHSPQLSVGGTLRPAAQAARGRRLPGLGLHPGQRKAVPGEEQRLPHPRSRPSGCSYQLIPRRPRDEGPRLTVDAYSRTWPGKGAGR